MQCPPRPALTARQAHRAARRVAGDGHVGQLGTAGQVVDGAAAHRGPVAGHLHVGEGRIAALIVQRAAVVAGRIAAERGIADGRVAAAHQRHGPALLGDVAHQGQVVERGAARFGEEAAALVLLGRRAAVGLAAGDGETVQIARWRRYHCRPPRDSCCRPRYRPASPPGRGRRVLSSWSMSPLSTVMWLHGSRWPRSVSLPRKPP